MLKRRLLLGGILSLLAAMFLVPFLLIRHFEPAIPPAADLRDSVGPVQHPQSILH